MGAVDETLPGWFDTLVRQQQKQQQQQRTGGESVPLPPAPVANGGNRIMPSRRPLRKRGSPDNERIAELEETVRILEAKLNSLEGVQAAVELKEEELIQVRLERDNLGKRCSLLEERVKELVEELERRNTRFQGLISYRIEFNY